ncbi:flippase [Flavobacterium sp.]|uniref:flippase n=1 Tax=Flavobacterium sp. TaxID=239 RepID=UPI003D2CF66A
MTKPNNSFKKLISTSGINFLFRIFGLASSFLIVFFISRFFGVTNYGNYSLSFTISQATAMIFALGIPNALILVVGNRKLSLKEAKTLLFKGIKIALLFSIIPFLFFFFYADIISEVFGSLKLIPFFKIISAIIPLFIIHELFLYYFIAIKNFKLYNIFMFVLPNIILGLFLILFYFFDTKDFFTLLAFAITMLLVVLGEYFLTYESKLPNISISTKSLIKVAFPMLFSGLLLYLLNWTDVIMLGLMTDEKQVGIYNIAYKIGSVGFLVIVSVSTIITPRMAELYGGGNISELKKVIQNATQLIAILSIPLVFALIVLNEFILSFFGVEIIVGSSTLIIISLGVLFSAMAGNVDQILNMTNNQKILRNITIFSFFINVFLNYILIPLYGINGAAIASLVSNVIINLLCVYYIKKKLGFYTLF